MLPGNTGIAEHGRVNNLVSIHILNIHSSTKREKVKESIKLEGGHKMSEKEKMDLGKPNKDLKGRTEGEASQDGRIREKKGDSFICPVCGKLITGKYLPDIQGYIVERLYSAEGFRVISQTVLECDSSISTIRKKMKC